jgi:hypothetical protein
LSNVPWPAAKSDKEPWSLIDPAWVILDHAA